MRTILQEGYADRVQRERKEKGLDAANQFSQSEWTSEAPPYGALLQQNFEPCKELERLSEHPTRKFRLSRSPLDSLQVEFRRYGNPGVHAKGTTVCCSPDNLLIALSVRRVDEMNLPWILV